MFCAVFESVDTLGTAAALVVGRFEISVAGDCASREEPASTLSWPLESVARKYPCEKLPEVQLKEGHDCFRVA